MIDPSVTQNIIIPIDVSVTMVERGYVCPPSQPRGYAARLIIIIIHGVQCDIDGRGSARVKK